MQLQYETQTGFGPADVAIASNGEVLPALPETAPGLPALSAGVTAEVPAGLVVPPSTAIAETIRRLLELVPGKTVATRLEDGTLRLLLKLGSEAMAATEPVLESLALYHAIPAAPLLNGQVADILIVLAACLGRSCPPGIKLTDHTIHDKVRSASLAFEDQAGWAHVALYHQDDVSFDGEAPEWETFTVAPVSLVIPALALLAAHLTVFRHLNHLLADPGQ